MDQDLADLAFAAEMRLAHGHRAGQMLVDLIQQAIRTRDEEAAQAADRALRLLSSPLDRGNSMGMRHGTRQS